MRILLHTYTHLHSSYIFYYGEQPSSFTTKEKKNKEAVLLCCLGKMDEAAAKRAEKIRKIEIAQPAEDEKLTTDKVCCMRESMCVK